MAHEDDQKRYFVGEIEFALRQQNFQLLKRAAQDAFSNFGVDMNVFLCWVREIAEEKNILLKDKMKDAIEKAVTTANKRSCDNTDKLKYIDGGRKMPSRLLKRDHNEYE